MRGFCISAVIEICSVVAGRTGHGSCLCRGSRVRHVEKGTGDTRRENVDLLDREETLRSGCAHTHRS